MTVARRTVREAGLQALLLLAALAGGAGAQTPTMPSTLRYGSGLIDVPVSSVLPHLHITSTLSGFFSGIGRRVEIDERGLPSGYGPARSEFYEDAAFAIGLLDRAEAGLTFQSFGGQDEGGNMWGMFGRVRIWEPIDQGLGLAVGARYVTSPSFAGAVAYAPGRLGFPDERLRKEYTEARGLRSNFSPYVVTTAFLRGFDGGRLPKNDMSVTLGYGGGLFREGGDIDPYAEGASNGWFVGGALHVDTSPRSQLTLMAEHNGFDVNVGVHYDWDGFRAGAQYLATNHAWPADGQSSEYTKPKFGLLASIALCPRARGLRCRPSAMRRSVPDTIYIPPPPPDTVLIAPAPGAGVPVLEGTPATICLSTGRNVPIRVTAAGDTLVGPLGTPVREVNPVLVFAGAYAGTAFWYQNEEVIVFEGGDFRPAGDAFPIDCDQILRVGVYQGVPVFAVITAERPLSFVFLPVEPGIWRRYER
jgi:hypothetical protein